MRTRVRGDRSTNSSTPFKAKTEVKITDPERKARAVRPAPDLPDDFHISAASRRACNLSIEDASFVQAALVTKSAQFSSHFTSTVKQVAGEEDVDKYEVPFDSTFGQRLRQEFLELLEVKLGKDRASKVFSVIDQSGPFAKWGSVNTTITFYDPETRGLYGNVRAKVQEIDPTTGVVLKVWEAGVEHVSKKYGLNFQLVDDGRGR